jgi:hypothetical protein
MPFLSTLDEPIFIIGMARSGTTLLRLMLTAHPDFCVPPESLFFVSLEPKYGNLPDLSENLDAFLDDLYGNERFRDWKVDRKLLAENLSSVSPLTYAKAVAIVYQTYRQQVDPTASFWGDKNPVHIYHIDRIRKHFPKARLLLISRDIRSIYASLLRNEKKFPGKWESSCIANVVSVTKQFNHAVSVIERYRDDERFYATFYRNLVNSPEAELRGICSWLGVDFSESMLRFHEKNQKEQLVPTRELGWHARTLKPVASDRLELWKKEVSPTELAALEVLNAENMQKLGYQRTTASSSARVSIKIFSDYLKHIYWKRERLLPNFKKDGARIPISFKKLATNR